MPVKPYTPNTRNRIARQQGLTLVELMVTVAIVAILAGIAYPSYQQYVVRSNRSLAQQFIQDVANREEEFLLNNRQYGSLTDLGLTAPSKLATLYTITAVPQNASVPYGYTITASPLAGTTQFSDGVITLDNLGTKTPASKW